MKPRLELYVALAGLVVAGIFGAPLFFTGEAIGDPNPEFLIVAFAGFVLGAIVTVVGLLLAGVGALTKQIDSPS